MEGNFTCQREFRLPLYYSCAHGGNFNSPELSVRQWIKYVTYDLINTENFKLPEDYLSIPVVIVEYKHFLLADNTNICPISLNIHRQEANSETK